MLGSIARGNSGLLPEKKKGGSEPAGPLSAMLSICGSVIVLPFDKHTLTLMGNEYNAKKRFALCRKQRKTSVL